MFHFKRCKLILLKACDKWSVFYSKLEDAEFMMAARRLTPNKFMVVGAGPPFEDL